MQGCVKLELIKDYVDMGCKHHTLTCKDQSCALWLSLCSIFLYYLLSFPKTIPGTSELSLWPFFFLLSWRLWDQCCLYNQAGSGLSSFLGFCWNQSLIPLQLPFPDTSFSRLQKKLCPLCASLFASNSCVPFSAFLEPSQMKRGIEPDLYLINKVFYILSTGVVVPDNCQIPWAIL